MWINLGDAFELYYTNSTRTEGGLPRAWALYGKLRRQQFGEGVCLFYVGRSNGIYGIRYRSPCYLRRPNTPFSGYLRDVPLMRLMMFFYARAHYEYIANNLCRGHAARTAPFFCLSPRRPLRRKLIFSPTIRRGVNAKIVFRSHRAMRLDIPLVANAICIPLRARSRKIKTAS